MTKAMDCYTIGICSTLELGTPFTVAVKKLRLDGEAADTIAAAAGSEAFPVFAKEVFVPAGENPFYPGTAEEFLARHRHTDPSFGVVSVPARLALDAP